MTLDRRPDDGSTPEWLRAAQARADDRARARRDALDAAADVFSRAAYRNAFAWHYATTAASATAVDIIARELRPLAPLDLTNGEDPR